MNKKVIITLILGITINLFGTNNKISSKFFSKASLHEKFSVGQIWKNKASTINKIAVFIFGPRKKTIDGKIVLSIRKTWDGEILASSSYNANNIPSSGKWIYFNFEKPVKLALGEKFYFRLACNLPAQNRCWVGAKLNFYPGGYYASRWLKNKIKTSPEVDLALKIYSPSSDKCLNIDEKKYSFLTKKITDPSFIAAKVIKKIGAEHKAKSRPFQGIPSISVCSNGRLWATWFGGGFGEKDENYVILVTSGDKGENWSSEKIIIDYPVSDYPASLRAFDPSIWLDPQGQLWLFWAQSYGWYDGRAGVWAITSKNPTVENPDWSAPKRLCDGVMINKPFVLKNGEWGMPVAQWSPTAKKQFVYHPDVPKDRYLSNMFVSTDKGQTWKWRGGADVPGRGHDENTIIERKDGSLWMLVRTKYGYGESFSSDNGCHWTKGKPAGFKNPTARIFIGRLKSGKLLLIKNGPIDKRTERSHMTAFLSDDDGKNWYGNFVIDERKEVSYPNAAQADDGTIYVIYDRSRYKEKEILMARFTEKDIAAAKCVSKIAMLKKIVNKAYGAPARIKISPAGGSFKKKTEVRLTYPIYGPWLYYTLDGSEPTRSSKHYTKPILIDKNTVIKAKAIGGKGGQHQSPVSKAKFKIIQTASETPSSMVQVQPLPFTRGSLFDKFSVGQSMKSDVSKISKIAVFIIGPKNKRTAGKVVLSIRKTWHGKILGSTSYNVDEIPPKGMWVDFEFESPISVVPGEKYFLRLDCNLPKKDRCQVGVALDYFYNLYPQGNFVSCWMHGKVKNSIADLAFKLYTPLAAKDSGTDKKKKMLLMNIDYSTNFEKQCAGAKRFGINKNKTPQQEIYNALKDVKNNGFQGVLWRVSYGGRVMYHSKIRDVFSKMDVKYVATQNMAAAIEKCDPLREAVKACRKLDLKIYAWMTINDSGNETLPQASFLQKNPQYQWVSRNGQRYLQGVPCYAYSEVRKHRLAQINELMAYGIDGLFMSTRSHTTGFSDTTLLSYGFNKPIVKAFKAKYGIDIIKNFIHKRDAEKLIKLRGNMMNQFYREVKKLRDRKYPKVKLAADLTHVPQNWPLWVKENLVDYLMVDSVSGNYGIIPEKDDYRNIPDLYVEAIKRLGGKTQVLMWIQIVNYKAGTYHTREQIYNDLYWLGKSKCAGGVMHEYCTMMKEPQKFWPYLEKALRATWK